MSGHTPLPADPMDLPLLPLRDVVVFPHMVIPLFVGRPKSIKALEAAMEAERRIMLVAQKAAAKDEPSVADMFEVGCISTILQMLKLPDGTVKVLVEGQQRARVAKITDGNAHFTATVTPVEATESDGKSPEIEALRRAVLQQFDQYVKLNKKIPPEILTSIASIDDPGRLADTIAAHLPLKLDNKQVVLDLAGVKERLENLFEQIEREVEILTSIASIDDAGRLADTIAAHLPLKLDNKQVVLDLADIKGRLENLFEQIEREVEPEDLIKFGLIPELVGRMPVVATLAELSEEALVQILTEPKNAMVKQYAKLLSMEGVDLEIRPSALRAIARKALARKTGARGLRSILEQSLIDTMFELPNTSNVDKVVVDESTIEENKPPLLVYREAAKKA